jgi:DNA-binding transcriptional LysR family regulator
MDFKRLKYFSRIAEIGSLNQAADRLLISQPSLSRQMRLLEEELGVRLFDRHRRGMRLTREGDDLYQRIAAPLAEITSAFRDIRARAEEGQASLSMALCPSVAQLLAAPLRRRIERDAPGLSLRLVEAFAGSTAMSLLRGELDIVMLYGPKSSWAAMEWGRAMAAMPLDDLIAEELVVVGSAQSDLDPARPVDLEGLLRMKLVLPQRINQIHAMKLLLDAMEARSQRPLDFIVADSLQFQTSIVEAGDAFAILPLSSVTQSLLAGRIRWAPFGGMTVDRNLVAVTNPETRYPRSARQVIAFLRDETRKLIEAGQWPGRVELRY